MIKKKLYSTRTHQSRLLLGGWAVSSVHAAPVENICLAGSIVNPLDCRYIKGTLPLPSKSALVACISAHKSSLRCCVFFEQNVRPDYSLLSPLPSRVFSSTTFYGANTSGMNSSTARSSKAHDIVFCIVLYHRRAGNNAARANKPRSTRMP